MGFDADGRSLAISREPTSELRGALQQRYAKPPFGRFRVRNCIDCEVLGECGLVVGRVVWFSGLIVIIGQVRKIGMTG